MGLLGDFGKKIGDAITNHAVNSHRRRMGDMNIEEILKTMKMGTTSSKKPKQPIFDVNNINPLLSEFPDNDLSVGKRVVAANVTEADEIVITVQMADGNTGSITIKASTIAQIIIDRNAKAATAKQETVSPDAPVSIDVGDGDLGSSEPTRAIPNFADADEPLAASKKGRLPSGVVGGPRRHP